MKGSAYAAKAPGPYGGMKLLPLHCIQTHGVDCLLAHETLVVGKYQSRHRTGGRTHMLWFVNMQSVVVEEVKFCTVCLQYFDAVGWAAGRASGL